MRREQRAFGWYALMALFWVLFIANVLVTSPWPFPDSLTAARANIMVLVLYVACFCVFTWRFGDQSLPRIEKALWLLAAVLLAAMAFVPQGHLPQVQLSVVLIVSAIFFANCLQFPFHALRTRRPEHAMLAACLLAFFAACAHDLLLMLRLIDGEATYTPFTSVVVTLCMSAVLGLRHARSVRRIERFNQELASGIEQARTELATTLEREHALALTNARLQDRLQIAHDLHDGLGGSLVRMMAVVEQASAPLHSQQFLSMLKLLRDDLRQTIDSGSSAGVTVPATPREWIAPLRHRFMQLFDELDISATWRVPELWRTPPSALQCMALTRLVEESLVNVLKHSRARRVELELRQSESDRLELRIEDDGVGFDVAAVLRAGISVGMRSMHARIARVGGELDVASQPGRTALTATLGLRTPQA
jgi:signal transduction histidine kinase